MSLRTVAAAGVMAFLMPAAAGGDSFVPEPPYELLTMKRNPRVGERFNAVVFVLQDPRRVASVAIRCSANIHGRHLPARTDRFFRPGTAVPRTIVVSWDIPRNSTGSMLEASCVVSLREVSETIAQVDRYDAILWRVLR